MIRVITLKNNWMNPCMKTEVKCNESVNNEFKITRKRVSLHQIMRWANKDTNSPYSHLLSYFLNSLFWYNSFAKVRQDSLHFDSIMSLTHYESISVTWANNTSHHILEKNLKQLGLWNYCLVFSNVCSVLYLVSSMPRTHYSIALKFSVVQLE